MPQAEKERLIGPVFTPQRSIPELTSRAEKLHNSINHAEKLAQELGTNLDLTPKRIAARYDITNPTSDSFIDNTIRVGKTRNALRERTIPTLSSIQEHVQVVLNDAKEKEQRISQTTARIAEMDSKIAELHELKAKGILPKDIITAAIQKAQKEVADLQNLINPPKEELQPSTVDEIKKGPRKRDLKRIEITMPSGTIHRASGDRAQVIQLLIGNAKTVAELAQEVLKRDDKKAKGNISSYLSLINGYDAPENMCILTKEPEGNGKAYRYRLIAKPEEAPQPPETSQPQKKEAPFMHPVPVERLTAISMVMEGIPVEKITSLFGAMKNGQPFNSSQARRAIEMSINFIAVRRHMNLATEEELQMWSKMQEFTHLTDPKETRKAFNEYLLTYFKKKEGQKKSVDSPSKIDAFPPVEAFEQPSEALMDKEIIETPKTLSPKELATLAQLIKQHHGINIQAGTKLLPFTVPEEIIEICDEIIEEYKKVGQYENENDKPTSEIRIDALETVANAFTDDKEAIAFIEEHEPSAQTILFWLESERAYIFELLLLNANVQNTVNTKRLELIERGKKIVGLKNGALEALINRLEPPQPSEDIPVALGFKTDYEDEYDDEIMPEKFLQNFQTEDLFDELSDPPTIILEKNNKVTIIGSKIEKPIEGRFADMRNPIQELLRDIIKKPEFSAGLASYGQLTRAYPSLTASTINKLIENGNIKAQGKPEFAIFSPIDAAIGLYIHKNRNLSKAQLKNLKKVAQEEFEKIQLENDQSSTS